MFPGFLEKPGKKIWRKYWILRYFLEETWWKDGGNQMEI
jgi:hypothetical protein